MLQNLRELYGHKLAALDGDIGHVKDFYFDDSTWAVRYLVADTGSWLTERLVLLTHHALGNHAFGRSDADADVLRVDLTRKQIEDSPSIDSHRPVSRQFEAEYYRYYGWPTYWQAGGMLGVGGFPSVTPLLTPEPHPHHGHNQRDDIHLRSTKAVTGYHIHATDGLIGSVSTFMVDGKSWAIRKWCRNRPLVRRQGNPDLAQYDRPDQLRRFHRVREPHQSGHPTGRGNRTAEFYGGNP